MDAQQLERLSLEDGKSETLRQAFALLTEATALEGGPKFDPKTCRDVARVIVCRTYAGPVLELCHLITLATRIDPTGRYEGVFWGLDRATASGFRHAFEYAVADGLDVQKNEVHHVMVDGRFTVTFGRMPFLLALFEVLITLMEYPALDALFDPLRAPNLDSKTVGQTANAVSRAVYAALKDHLPAVQAQRRNRAMISYLSQRSEDGLEGAKLDDEFILAYWQDASVGTEDMPADPDARTYLGVFHAAIRLYQAVEAAAGQDELSSARAIGTDREAGEVDPADVEALVDAIDDHGDDHGDLIAALQAPPMDRIKFLNGREQEVASDLMPGSRLAPRFARSVLRAACFGRAQARITAALRRGVDGMALTPLIDNACEETYSDRLAAYQDLVDHIVRVRKVVFHVLAQAEKPEAIGLALDLCPQADFGDLRAKIEKQADEDSVADFGLARAVRDLFAEVQTGTGPLAPLAQDAARLAKNLARQGFKPGDADVPEVMEGFVNAPAPLKALMRELTAFLDETAGSTDWEDAFGADHPIFTQQFQKIYGVSHV